MRNQGQETYNIKTKKFEGPFDLLLFFIERDELDINDIPITQITNDYLAYIKKLEEFNIDIASDFILMAATLMRIKAKLLLPRKDLDESGNEIDPRDELARRLLEYRRFKSVIDNMSDLEHFRTQKHERGGIKSELMDVASHALVDLELESINLYTLMRRFESVMERFEIQQKESTYKVKKYRYSVEKQEKFIFSTIRKYKKATFEQVFAVLENKMHAVITFLALLELLNLQELKITVGEGANNFWLEEN